MGSVVLVEHGQSGDDADRERIRRHLDAQAELDRMLMAAAHVPAADGTTGPLPRVPGQRRPAGHRTPKEARWLRAVPVIVLAALGGAAKRAWAAHPLPTAAAAIGAPVILTAAVAVGPHAAGQAIGAIPAAPASGLYSATPIATPSASPSIAAFLAKPRRAVPGLDVRSSGTTAPGLPPTYDYVPPVQPPSGGQVTQPAQSSQPSAQQQSGNVTLTVSTSAVDLTSGAPVTITISASGNGWASWHISAWDPQTQVSQADLDFSSTHGVLQAGKTATVTISLDATQDGAGQETFTVAGQDVTATLPGPPPAVVDPSPAPTDASIPAPTAS